MTHFSFSDFHNHIRQIAELERRTGNEYPEVLDFYVERLLASLEGDAPDTGMTPVFEAEVDRHLNRYRRPGWSVAAVKQRKSGPV